MNLKEADTNLLLKVMAKEGWFRLKTFEEKYNRDVSTFVTYYHRNLFDREKVETGSPGRPPYQYKLKENYQDALKSEKN